MNDNLNLLRFAKYADEHFSMSLESMVTLKSELIWLYTHLEIKGDESRMRGKPASKEYLQSIETVKRASLFISVYCLKLENMENELQELNRKLEYYKTQMPKVDLSKLKLEYNGSTIRYTKNN